MKKLNFMLVGLLLALLALPAMAAAEGRPTEEPADSFARQVAAPGEVYGVKLDSLAATPERSREIIAAHPELVDQFISAAQAGYILLDPAQFPPQVWAEITGINQGGLGAAWVDPDADRIVFWDDSASAFGKLTVGNGLNITTTSLTAVPSTSPSLAWGYATGAGGAVTQGTNKSTGVTMVPNPCRCGTITTHAAELAGDAEVSFVVTNSAVGVGDVVLVSVQSGASTGNYIAAVTATGAGTFTITITNVGATASETILINFVVIDSVTS